MAKRSLPKTSTRPLVGVSSPARSPSRVDLPEPDAPTTATVPPASTSKLTSSSIVSQPSASRTCFPSDSTLNATMIRPELTHERTILPDPARRGLLAALLALAATAGTAPPKALAADPIRVLVLGDSIAAEYGIARGSGWVDMLAARAAGRATFVNASISGETTTGGRNRLPGLLAEHRPDIVVIELGANDALRGLPLDETEANLDAMVQASIDAGARVLLLGMQVPPNYGRRYTERF